MESLRLVSPNAYLRYLDFPGDKTPIVFIHGMGCASTIDYARVIANPALAGHRFLLPDMLGHGYSDAPQDFSYAIDAHARTIATLLDQLSIKGAVVFGHSAGGSVAIALASQRRDLVGRLICSESNLNPGGGTVSKAVAAQTEEEFTAAGHRAVVQQVIATGWTSRAATFRTTNPIAFHRTARSLVEGSSPTWMELLVRLKIPRAWIVGEKDAPDDDKELFAPHGIPVFVVPGGDHDMAFGNPDGVAETIAGALRA
ncbi:MAG TPA: alpha/beta hydrolase [Candidatus Dormibacteraeota bacterium]|nr:alpha/beta hydrolase [Candidatus Dormibacteraeota bacterium]